MFNYRILIVAGMLPFMAQAMEIPNPNNALEISERKTTKAELRQIFSEIAIIHLKALDEVQALNKKVQKIETKIAKENFASCEDKNQILCNLALFQAQLSQESFRLGLIDNIIEKICNVEKNTITDLDKSTQYIDTVFIKYLKEHARLVELLKPSVHINENLANNVKETIRLVRLSIQNFIIGIESLNLNTEHLTIKKEQIAQKYEFTEYEKDLFVNDVLHPYALGDQLKKELTNIKRVFEVVDKRNNTSIYLYQVKDESMPAFWYESTTQTISKWYKNPEINLQEGGYRDPNNHRFTTAKYAIPFHAFPLRIDDYAKKYGFFETNKNETKVLLPGSMVIKGKIIYGTFEIFFADSCCYHRFFNPLHGSDLTESKSKMKKEQKSSGKIELSEIKENTNESNVSLDNVACIMKYYMLLLEKKSNSRARKRMRADEFNKIKDIVGNATKEERRKAKEYMNLSKEQKEIIAGKYRKHEIAKNKAKERKEELRKKVSQNDKVVKLKSSAKNFNND